MSLLSLNLVPPIAEQLREQGPLRDPANPDWAVVSVHEKGKADQVILATSEAYMQWAEDDYEMKRQMEKQQRQRVHAHVDDLHRAAEGITPYHQLLMEMQARQTPAAQAVNGTPIITSGHKLAAAIDRVPRPVAKAQRPTCSSAERESREPEIAAYPSEWKERWGITDEEVDTTTPEKPPIFGSLWEKEEWYREDGEVSPESDGAEQAD